MALMELEQAISLVQAKRMAKEAAGRVLTPPTTTNVWPIDYERVYAWRAQQLAKLQADEELLESAKAYYRLNPIDFTNHWFDTYDPRNVGTNVPAYMPFVMFQRQEDLMRLLIACREEEGNALVEKCRDMGATWDCIALSTHMWLFEPGSASGWGSATAKKVDDIGDASSIFEKIRIGIRRLPDVFKPSGFNEKKHMMHQRIVNPETAGTITGEIGDNIGRGGRTGIYFVDEAAYIERPEAVDASLSENTRVRIDISSVSGLGTVFHRTRMSGVEWEPGQPIHRDRTNVFVMDYSQHPTKTKKWFNERKSYWEAKGMPHVFAREIERNYAAAVEGIVIPSEYVQAAIDAHKKIEGWEDEGGWTAGLDVADGGQDRNALIRRKGSIIKSVHEWPLNRDPGITARKAVAVCREDLPCALQYDCIGIGAGVKTETNRLREEDLLPKGLRVVAWNAGGKVLNGGTRLIPDDEQSPRNKDYYGNLKAQAWWELRLRFYRTWHMITTMGTEDAVEYDSCEMISIDSKAVGQKMLIKLIQELSQAVIKHDSKMRMIIDKAPNGASSPNLADGTVMAFWPLPFDMLAQGMALTTGIKVIGAE